MAGYAGTSLIKKLGIKINSHLVLLCAPAGFLKSLGALPAGVKVSTRFAAKPDLIHYFISERRKLATVFPALARQVDAGGTVWISWPKQASAVETDLDENVVRSIGLRTGLVDVKVCAIDDTWSGLKFVVRAADRPTRRRL